MSSNRSMGSDIGLMFSEYTINFFLTFNRNALFAEKLYSDDSIGCNTRHNQYLNDIYNSYGIQDYSQYSV